MYTVTFKCEGKIEIEKPHDSISIRNIEGEVQVKKSILFGRVEPVIIANYRWTEFDELDSGTTFHFEGKTPFTVICELN